MEMVTENQYVHSATGTMTLGYSPSHMWVTIFESNMLNLKRFYEYFIPASEHKTIENILEKN